ncbi:MAG: D-alanine--D-alanine ligase [Prolixibacteraceae bacterium]|jgi:D-alanine-D-alanine ligase|nr:D-alanine--D-alanine ligase [Prolixibacteraceae bacterium]
MKKNIAVIGGGDSSEYVVSIKSSANILSNIDTNKYKPWLIRMRFDEWVVLDGEEIIAVVEKGDFSFQLNGVKIKPEYAFIMIHGTPGEDGVLQGYFDMLKIPYSASSVYASALTFHKFYCDNFLRSFNIRMAKSAYFQKGDVLYPEKLVSELGLPLFIKPSGGGSSFGVTKVRALEEVVPAAELAYKESGDCLVEEFIEGMELAVGVCELNGEIVPFLPTEVIPKGDFFDFDSKYEIGGATEITPARLTDEKIKECQELSVKLYKLIDCHGIVRVDFIMKNNEFYFLEINTVPGMTATSFIPQQLNAMGLNLKDIVSQLIESDLKFS